MRKFDLQERLVDYVMLVDGVINILPQTLLMKQLAGQLTRSSSSTALNYSEAISSESQNDFIHKIKIVLKELRESYTCLRIIQKKYIEKPVNGIDCAIRETDELIAIFSKTIQTAKNNLLEMNKLNNTKH